MDNFVPKKSDLFFLCTRRLDGGFQSKESSNLTAEYGLARGLPVGEHAPQPLCLLLGLSDKSAETD
jgi:hypothetical protein